MDISDKNEALFSEFSAVSKQEWKDKIIQDLKGADYNKKLVWHTREGFDVEPIYSSEDLPDPGQLQDLPGNFPFKRGNKTDNNWHIRQDIQVDDIKNANKKALDILMKGVTSLGFIINSKFEPSIDELEKLCENIYADAVELNFVCYHNSLKVVKDIEKLAKKYNRQLYKIYGSVDFDPLGQYALTGKFPNSEETSFDQAKQIIEAAGHLPNFKVITINGSYFHNSGSGIVQELAFSLAQGVGYLTQLTERGLSINQVAPRLKFQFAIGSNYFMEIAKLRAARLLWANIVKAYGPSDDSKTRIYIHSVTSNWNKTMYDSYVNMLRTTTEAMSGITGGTDSLTIHPFNSAYEETTEFSERIARNQQLLLKEESYIDKVADPAAGSYYIENLTQSIVNHAWKLFLEVQEKGGFLESFKAGFIQEQIKETARQRDLEIATRKKVLLGTNQYPNSTEFISEDFETLANKAFKIQDQDTDTETLKPYRGAMA
ncbi:MAG: methylmalonyl-CoA mutase subunit beta, partial [Bacteroidales bacterium]|nr:methylmalonyl-CoA mutase subunit beta [Bacteroidales bacterium]